MKVGNNQERIEKNIEYEDGRLKYLRFKKKREFKEDLIVEEEKQERIVKRNIEK